MTSRLWDLITSTSVALALFIVLAVLAVVGTLPGMVWLYHHPAFIALLGLLGTSTLCCTIRRGRAIAWPVLVIHGGVLVTLTGAVVSWFGFVATVNLYEGTTVEQAYRWDLERDEPLGFGMTVRKINREFYPVPVKVGILKGSDKVGLQIVKTGDSFDLGTYRVKVDRFEPAKQNLMLVVSEAGNVIGTADTEGATTLPATFPYQFKLVAFQNPRLKRLWVDIRLNDGPQTLAEGTSEVNAPLHWNELSFFNTQVSTDPAGQLFAGIQIVKDPGRPVVFAGMLITSIGGLLAFARRKVWS